MAEVVEVVDTVAAALVVERLTRHFAAVTALNQIGFAVARGEVVALLGENGAGKSTLVEILSGSLKAHGGTIEVAGRRYQPRDPRQAGVRRVGVVHQHFQLIEALTVAENLWLNLGDLSRAELAARWTGLATELGVELPPLSAVVRELGVGQRQWLEVGKALLRRPLLLLLDEPTAVLTPAEAEKLFVVVRRLAEKGTAVLFITHRLDEVRQIAQRVVVLCQGKVVAELPANAPSSTIAEAMTGALPPARTRSTVTPGQVVARLCEVAMPPRLQPLSLSLHAGQVVVMAGVDGSGQVAAAERLCGLTAGPGELEIRGERLRDPRPDQLRRRGVLVIPGDRSRQGLAPSLSVAENLVLGRRHRRWLAPHTVTAEAEQLISRFAIVGTPDQPVAQLSGGNQQKVVVARALAVRPQLLVAIHPTRGLDLAAQRAVREHLLAAAASGTAVLVVTADLDEARIIGDRILVFSRGLVIGRGDRSTRPELLARWLGGEAA